MVIIIILVVLLVARRCKCSPVEHDLQLAPYCSSFSPLNQWCGEVKLDRFDGVDWFIHLQNVLIWEIFRTTDWSMWIKTFGNIPINAGCQYKDCIKIFFFFLNQRSISTCLMILNEVSELNCHPVLISEAKFKKKKKIASQTFFF